MICNVLKNLKEVIAKTPKAKKVGDKKVKIPKTKIITRTRIVKQEVKVPAVKTRTFSLEVAGFNGFYNTPLGDFISDQLNFDLQHLDDSLSILKINEFECFQKLKYKNYYKDVAEIFVKNFLSSVNNCMSNLITLVDTDYKVVSPAKYNNATDKIYISVKVKEKDYYKLVGFVLGSGILDKLCEVAYYDRKPSYCLSFGEITSDDFSCLFHYALFISLLNESNAEVSRDVFASFIEQIEKETYQELSFGYSQYVNWDLYRQELRTALKRYNIKADEDVVDNNCSVLWELVDCFCIKGNRLVIK